MKNLSLPNSFSVETVLEGTGAPFSVRIEQPGDRDWVTQLHRRAFGPGRFARAAFRVREVAPLAPRLCLLAHRGDERLGSVWMTRVQLGEMAGHLLGPLAIEPDARNQGIGRGLVEMVSMLALRPENGEFVLLVGDAPYYAPLGFVPVPAGQVRFPGPVDPARILVRCADGTCLDKLQGRLPG